MALPRQAFGSPLGWFLAGVVVVVVVAGLAVVHRARSATPTTAVFADASLWQTAPLAVDLDPVLTRIGPAGEGLLSSNQDTGEHYREAIDLFVSSRPHRLGLEDFLRPGTTRSAKDENVLGFFEMIEQGGAGKAATIFAGEPEVLINYDRGLERLRALEQIGQAALKQASLLISETRDAPDDAARQRGRDEARRLFAVTAALGQALQREQIIYKEFEAGGEFLSAGLGGLIGLAKLEQNKDVERAVKGQRDALSATMAGPITTTWEAIATINDPAKLNDAADIHAGDVLAIASRNEAHPMWRVEAILRTGKLRFDATRPGDAVFANRLLEALETAVTDEHQKLALEQATDLTKEQMRNAR